MSSARAVTVLVVTLMTFGGSACALFSDAVACDDATPCPAPRECASDGFCALVGAGEGEGEGTTAEGEGEGEGAAGEGEGEGAVGEGEGEGEGEGGEGEGEGEGAPSPTCGATAQTGDYCAGDKVSNGTTGTLYRCTGPGPANVKQVCALGCVVAAAGHDDFCQPPPTCDSNAVTGDYCGGDKVSNGSADTLYHCTGPGAATVIRLCAQGCLVRPGQDDICG